MKLKMWENYTDDYLPQRPQDPFAISKYLCTFDNYLHHSSDNLILWKK